MQNSLLHQWHIQTAQLQHCRYISTTLPSTKSCYAVRCRSSFTFWLVKDLAELAERPTPYMKWQGQSLCFTLSANLPTLCLYRLLALSFTLHYFTGQNKNHVRNNMVSPSSTTMWHPRP